jgi:hypothetical protein
VTLLLERRELAKSSSLNAAPEAVTRYLADRGVPTKSTLGLHKNVRIYEETIRAGDAVCVLGHASVEAGAVRTEAHGYRSTAKRSFGFRADAAVVIATGTRQSVLDAVAGPFYRGAAICAGSALVAVAVIVAALFSQRSVSRDRRPEPW